VRAKVAQLGFDAAVTYGMKAFNYAAMDVMAPTVAAATMPMIYLTAWMMRGHITDYIAVCDAGNCSDFRLRDGIKRTMLTWRIQWDIANWCTDMAVKLFKYLQLI